MADLKAACIQLNCGPDIEENMVILRDLVAQAAGAGAQFITTPENTCHMRAAGKKLESAQTEEESLAVQTCSELAKEHAVWLLAGSLSIKISDEKIANRSFLFDEQGEIVARYDKIHLFDVDLPTGESHRESDLFEGGDKAVVAHTPWFNIGMSICYDVRFAHLFRHMAQAGAQLMTVPAAFTVPTGQAHWETLLRARAIETGSFVIAPAQVGEHEGGRKTYGHSLIIAPWGEVLADGGEDVGFITADIDLSLVEKARTAIPALQHDRPFELINLGNQ